MKDLPRSRDPPFRNPSVTLFSHKPNQCQRLPYYYHQFIINARDSPTITTTFFNHEYTQYIKDVIKATVQDWAEWKHTHPTRISSKDMVQDRAERKNNWGFVELTDLISIYFCRSGSFFCVSGSILILLMSYNILLWNYAFFHYIETEEPYFRMSDWCQPCVCIKRIISKFWTNICQRMLEKQYDMSNSPPSEEFGLPDFHVCLNFTWYLLSPCISCVVMGSSLVDPYFNAINYIQTNPKDRN